MQDTKDLNIEMVLRRLGVGNNIIEGWGGNKSLAGCWRSSVQEKYLGKHCCWKFMINGFPASCVHIEGAFGVTEYLYVVLKLQNPFTERSVMFLQLHPLLLGH